MLVTCTADDGKPPTILTERVESIRSSVWNAYYIEVYMLVDPVRLCAVPVLGYHAWRHQTLHKRAADYKNTPSTICCLSFRERQGGTQVRLTAAWLGLS